VHLSQGLAEFYGILVGDGCLSHVPAYVKSGPKYSIRIFGNSTTDYEFIVHVASLINRLFGRSVRIRKRFDCNGIEIGFSSKNVFFLLHNLGFPIGKKRRITIPPVFLRDNLWIHVTRGIFDTDGCVVFSRQHRSVRYYPRIEITNSSRELIDQLRQLLLQVGLGSSCRQSSVGSWRLEVAGAQNFEK